MDQMACTSPATLQTHIVPQITKRKMFHKAFSQAIATNQHSLVELTPPGCSCIQVQGNDIPHLATNYCWIIFFWLDIVIAPVLLRHRKILK